MANIPVPTPIRRSVPVPTPIRSGASTIKAPKPLPKAKARPKAPPKPYNPLTATMPSLGQLTTTAQQHANADTAAAIAKLPSADDIRRLADATAARQAANQAALQHTASSAGGAFQQAYTAAQNPTNSAIIAAGGTPTAGGPAAGAGGALAALGTIMGQSLGGQAASANAQGLQAQLANQREASTIRQGTVAAANKYLDDLKQQAFQVAQARANNAIAQQTYGLNLTKAQAGASQAAQNEADRVAIANANRQAANDRAQLASSTQLQTASMRKAAAKSSAANPAKAAAARAKAWNTTAAAVRQMVAQTRATGKFDNNGNPITTPRWTGEQVRRFAVIQLINNGWSQAAARQRVMQAFPFLPAPPPDFSGVKPPPRSHGGAQSQ